MSKRNGGGFTRDIDLSKSDISRWTSLRNRLEAGTLMKALAPYRTKHRSSQRGRSNSSFGSGIGIRKSKFGSDVTGGGSGVKFNAKLLILEAKSRHDAAKKKQKERSERRRLRNKQIKLEKQLEYLNFPTIMGWYFGGFHTTHFQLNEEYAAIFNELEQEVAQKKERAYKETFNEKAKRNFWPPHLISGVMFRTKGVYLDFKEILKDPPRTPPDVITDRSTKAVTLYIKKGADIDETDSKVPSSESIQPVKMTVSEFDKQFEPSAKHPVPSFTNVKTTFRDQLTEEMKLKYTYKDAFYFDDSIPGFFRKKLAQKANYYFDTQFNVWRVKRNPVTFANDFFFDDRRGMFLAKDRTKPKDAYMYYPADGCYREAGEVGPANWRGLTPKSFYWDEKIWKWQRIALASKDVKIVLDPNANRQCQKNPKAKTPDDFYYDTMNKTFKLKSNGKDKDYFYDWALGAWRDKTDPEPQKGTTNTSGFYWNEVDHSFLKKDAPSAFFVYDTNNRFFRKKKSVRGKYHPKNWNWNEKKKTWELKKNAQSRFFTESLYWRPDREYDKPWLEYTGGYNRYEPSTYNPDEDVDPQRDRKVKRSHSEPLKSSAEYKTPHPVLERNASELQLNRKELQLNPSPSTAATATSAPGPSAPGPPVPEKKEEPVPTPEPEPPAPLNPIEEALRIADLYETKVLKVTNLGAVVTDGDLKAYFASVHTVLRPKVANTNRTGTFAYLYFPTEEAAEAALQSMQGKVIKGQALEIRYKLKTEVNEKEEEAVKKRETLRR